MKINNWKETILEWVGCLNLTHVSIWKHYRKSSLMNTILATLKALPRKGSMPNPDPSHHLKCHLNLQNSQDFSRKKATKINLTWTIWLLPISQVWRVLPKSANDKFSKREFNHQREDVTGARRVPKRRLVKRKRMIVMFNSLLWNHEKSWMTTCISLEFNLKGLSQSNSS